MTAGYRTPRVLHIITGLGIGGAERTLANLLEAGLARNFANGVVSLGSHGQLGRQIASLDVPVVALNMPAGRPTLSGFSRLRRLLREFQPSVIQGWMYHGNLAAWIAGFQANTKPSISWNVRHSFYGLAVEKPGTRKIIRANRMLSGRADVIIYNSKVSRRQHEAFGFGSSRAKVIPNGVNIDVFRPSNEARVVLRAEMNVPKGAFVVGHIARFHAMKDHKLFVSAAVRLTRKHPDVYVVLVGTGVTNDNRALTAIVPASLRSRFRFSGERHDIEAIFNMFDLFCSSSAWGEAWPNVIGEAMATAVPCVVTDVGDSACIVGSTGEVVPPRSEHSLVEGLERFVEMSLTERLDRGAAARGRIERVYALEAAVDRYCALFGSLVANRD